MIVNTSSERRIHATSVIEPLHSSALCSFIPVGSELEAA